MHVNWRASSMHAAVVALCNSVMQTVVAFGAHLTGQENVSITALVNSVLVLISVAQIATSNGNARTDTHP